MFLLKCVEARDFVRKQPACSCHIREACDTGWVVNNLRPKARIIQIERRCSSEEVMKKCGVCKQDKIEAMFYRNKAKLDGLQAYCKACLLIERAKHRAAHPLYFVWVQIIQRCTKPNNPNYHQYGGRGIDVFTAWKEDFSRFERDVMPLWKPGLQIDRIENDYGYFPGNIRFVSSKENNRNRRDNLLLTIGNSTRTSAEWSEISGINRKTLQTRLADGWSPAEAVFTPTRKYYRNEVRAGG